MKSSRRASPGSARVWLAEDGIINAQFRDAREISLPDGQEAIAAIVRAANGNQRPLLADFMGVNVRKVERAARMNESYPALPAAVSAIAVITTSPTVRILMNFTVLFYPGESSLRLFNTHAEAIEWLKEFLK